LPDFAGSDLLKDREAARYHKISEGDHGIKNFEQGYFKLEKLLVAFFLVI